MEKPAVRNWTGLFFPSPETRERWKSNLYSLSTLVVRATATLLLTVGALRAISSTPSPLHDEDTASIRYLFVFGDSYSTTGFNVTNTPQPSTENPFGNPPFPGARQSGGEIWLDVVVNQLNNTVAYDFAVGGNTVNSTQADGGEDEPDSNIHDFRGQLREFETLNATGTHPWRADNSLFINWLGVNDISVQIYSGKDWNTTRAILRPDNGDYFDLLDRQYHLGARNIITILVPPIDRCPVFDYGHGDRAPEVRNATRWWNSHIQDQKGQFRSQHEGLHSLIVDATPVFERVLDHPEAYGAPNSTCVSYPDGQPCLWHDFIHPGIAIQHEVGEYMVEKIRGMGVWE